MSQPNILVVDDEPGIVLLCERVLTGAGYAISAFSEPENALEVIKTQKVDLLLVDIRMPKLSGLELIDLAKISQPEMAVLVMTGFGTVETAIDVLHKGVDGLILKPFERQALLSSVERAIQDNQKKQDIARLQALQPLFALTESLISETDPAAVVDLILAVLSRQMECNNVAIYRTRKSDQMELVSGRGKLPDLSKYNPLQASNERGAPIWSGPQSRLDVGLQTVLEQTEISSVMIVPTGLTNTRPVIYVARDKDQPVFREADFETFLVLARQCAVAYENAHLYDELRRYVKKLEDSQMALVQAEKLATAGRLTASIAHEINNPLQSVRNCLHLATHGDVTPEMREKYIDLTKQELDRLMTTVQRMLDFYRTSAEFRPVQVLDLVEHVLDLMGQQLKEREIRVTTSWPASLPPVMAISNQIEQVFINIILNAFDAMLDGGNLSINISQKKKQIEILFEDSGPGVPDDLRESIFEPFISSKGGTGLGLSVSYDIITAHGGRLDLLKKQGSGACFRISLPIKE